MKINSLSLLLFVLFVNSLAAQDFGPANDELLLEREFWESEQNLSTALDSLAIWQEQVLLHTDKKALVPKDYLFFKAYVLTGPDQLRVSASDVLKIELLDEKGTLINSQYHKISNGAAQGSVMIPKKSKSGKHYLRAYTRWMLNYGPENFAKEEITVLDKKNVTPNSTINEPEVDIFPEGGAIMARLENRVAVRLNNLNGGTIEVLDDTGNEVAYVKDYGNGLGTFLLTPETGKKYFLKIGDNKFPLPDSGNTGYTMQLNNIGVEKSIVKVAATENVKNQEIYLRGRVNGIQLFESKVEFEDTNSIEIDIPKASLPNGIIQLQLEDEFEQVWATRPLHIDNNQLHFDIEKSMGIDGEVVKIRVTDDDGAPVKTEISMALGQLDYRDNIENDRNQRFVNDLLVLTNRLPENNALNNIDALPTEIKYNFQKGLEFYGRAYDLDAVPLNNTKIQIVISGEGDPLGYEVQTNEDGLFKLSGLQIDGAADMVFRRIAEDQRNKFVKVVPYQYETPPLTINKVSNGANGELSSKQFIPKKQVTEFREDENVDRLISLEGVTLVGEKVKVNRTPSVYNIEPRHVIRQNPERPKFMSELFFNIPGLVVSGGRDFPSLGLINRGGTVSGSGGGPLDSPGPLWIIDGVNVGSSTFFNPEWGLTHIDIDRIEILNSSDASMWGSRGNQGVIAIYTRNGSDEEYLNRKKGQLTFEGYSNSLSFEAYQSQVVGKRKKIETSTLYWNPSLVTDENGEAIIKLPNDLGNEALEVNINVVTPDGKMGRLQRIL